MGKIVGLVFDEVAAAKLVCPCCDKEYKSAEALEKHIKDKHPESVNGSAEPPRE